jgi:hypothetical protein
MIRSKGVPHFSQKWPSRNWGWLLASLLLFTVGHWQLAVLHGAQHHHERLRLVWHPSESARVHVQLAAGRVTGAGSSSQVGSLRHQSHGDLRTASAAVQGGASTNSGSGSKASRTQQINVLFGMIGRDIATELPYVLRNIESLAVHFKQAQVVLVENDSSDDTRAVFEAWGNAFQGPNRTATLVTLPPGSRRGKKDISLLARARNAYIEQLGLPAHAEVDVLIAVDSDMCFKWDTVRMVRVINVLLPGLGSAWHVLYANGVCGWYRGLQTPKQEEVPPHTPGAAPVYCDLLALRDTLDVAHVMTPTSLVSLTPGSCDFSHMSNLSAASFRCGEFNGEHIVPVQAAFGGWAMYDARLLRPSKRACKHDPHAGGCEHWSMSKCLVQEWNATQIVAPAVVVDWEGCSEKEQHRWDGWFPGRGPL